MHVQYVTAHVTLAVLSIACCVFEEFIRGVHHPLMMMQILSCASFVLLPQAESPGEIQKGTAKNCHKLS